jgi:RNA polymerase sigma-70 factor (ECF subfamily)
MDHDKHDPSHCLEMFEKLSEYIDGELDSVTCEEIERHAETCIPCKICLMTLKKTVTLCKGAEAEVPVPGTLSEKMKALIKELQQNSQLPSK